MTSFEAGLNQDEASRRAEIALFASNALDPLHTLPPVEVIASLNQPEAQTTRFDILHAKRIVGICDLTTRGDEQWLEWIQINRLYVGKGFGIAACSELVVNALWHGYVMRSDPRPTSEPAKKIWDRLVNCGLAEIIEPFRAIETGSYMGHYRIKRELLLLGKQSE